MPNDASAWFAIVAKPEVHRFLPLSRAPSADDARAWIDRQMAQQEREGFSFWPAIRKTDAVLVGACGLDRLPGGDVEIAWIFDSAVWKTGLATEAGRAVLGFARDHVRERVGALVDPMDRASIALVNRLGMRFDRLTRAHHRDALRYAVVG
jgi:RimJ/RimL family protein N-acetyltransferase